ncbi:phage tail tape measure protein [Staphylococcus pseudintermedius]|uniref:phage tail tape measure protein n=1 Tax=Staphylococcus pseudintermedius TaxID=283734 RepID=UPI00286E94C7|nr:phage tail tape measure protein [Staphylococcus pseudintermedius]
MAERIKGLQIDLSMQDMGIGSTLAGIRRSFRQLNSDLKLSSNNFKYSEKSMTSYKNRIRELDAATKQQRNNVKELRNQYMQTAKEQGANSAKAVRLRTEYNKQADTLNRLEHELEQTVDGFKRFQKEAQEAARVSNSSFGRLGQKFTDIGPKLTSVGESMKSVGRSMSMYVTAPVVAGFGLAAKKSIDFDDSMRKVKATSGATGKEFNLLRDKALEMGAKTKFSASESAEALQYMSLAGWDTKDMLNGIDGVMQLAAASGEDLAQVSDIVTDGLSAFGLKAKDSSHFADVLAQTSSKANTDVSGLGEAFKYVAPVAGSFGFSVEDTSIALGLMANSGVKASQAGTALKSMMTKLAKPTGEAKKTMESLGISITDSEGKMLPFRDIMDQLRGSLGGLSKAQQSAAVKTLFGQEAMSGILPIINASDEDYQKLTKSIDNSAGASKRMSGEMEGGIGGSIRKMKSAIESMAISIGDVLAPHIRRAADFLAMLADKFTSMPGWVKTGVVGLGVFAASLGPLILTTGMFTAALGSIMTTLGPLMTGIVKAGGLMNFLGTKAPFAAKGLTLVGGAFKFMLGPVGLAIAAVVAIGTAFVVAYKKSETFRNIVHTVIDPVVNAFKNLWNTAKEVFNSLKSLLSGNTLPTVDLLSKIMPKATANRVTVNLMKVRQTFINVFNAIWNFGREIGGKIASFWKQNGDDVIQAFVNIGNFFKGFFIELRNLISMSWFSVISS